MKIKTAVTTAFGKDAQIRLTLTYSLSGTDASAFDISSTGVITFKTAPDYETKSEYNIDVIVKIAKIRKLKKFISK